MADDKTIQPITDDAELAKVLDGMKADQPSGLSFEETATAPAADTAQPADQPAAETPVPDIPMPDLAAPATDSAGMADPGATAMPPMPGVDSDLDSIKKSALEELRPLVDKLNLPAEEKFDTLLLIIRSTDDKSLVSQAYEAARAIEDESKRAESLLDIIKEIDYFANPQQTPQA